MSPVRLPFPELLAAILALAVIEGLDVTCVDAAERVKVELRNGRVLVGTVSDRTDAANLWLQSAEPSILLMSSTPWSEVAFATVGKARLSAEDFQSAAEKLKSPIPVATIRKPALSVRTSAGRTDEQDSRTVLPTSRVQSLEILASLANWDRDAETDGIELRLSPLTRDDDLAMVEGLATVRLLGRRLGTRERLESQARFGFWGDGSSVSEYWAGRWTDRYVELGRWTERIRVADYSDVCDVVRLPFRRVHPEYDLDVGVEGLIDVHFSVQGQGVFHASAPVELRSYNPLRDDLELYRRTRFFPDEHRGR